MIAIIRIKGKVGIRKDVEETLNRLRLRRKYTCVVVREKKEILGMLKKVKDYVAYGKIDKKTFVELVKKRGLPLKRQDKGKIDAEKVVREFIESKTEKKLDNFGIKNFFRLHPPRGGIKSKEHFPKGVLGNNKEKINDLIKRML